MDRGGESAHLRGLATRAWDWKMWISSSSSSARNGSVMLHSRKQERAYSPPWNHSLRVLGHCWAFPLLLPWAPLLRSRASIAMAARNVGISARSRCGMQEEIGRISQGSWTSSIRLARLVLARDLDSKFPLVSERNSFKEEEKLLLDAMMIA
ncbi:uncharacterized protein LOC112343355 [Selaginella moellendorffii]|uniref:uncharacterized protein LOC112342931 n=1 Tax=Selaginella moellendorffii TaxID=88036 RepID=UPI000D1C7E3A|nr:uncharacterized protein LOC112342931 [Selaginella moellendorffii]XP_024522440.1 uncharacterized protein LOC112343355 [Selaginella moellendorffii]|eukprot:XP_024521337.1 uncharacterized protein LOC112342931 [Selaginella moellendorffii]